VKVSVVVEGWNVDSREDALAHLLRSLAPQLAAAGAELVVTHAGLRADARAALAADARSAHSAQTLEQPIRWVELPADAGYYEHKNAGFAATSGDVIAFTDGDCDPSPGWLAALLAPFADGARVVAGATSYAGPLAPLANELDFPYFDTRRRPFGATTPEPSRTVLNFFANNVAFARDAFPGYPRLSHMFKGAWKVLALRLAEAGATIAFAPDARVTHAWPEDPREWLETRLLRGADGRQVLPYVLAAHAPVLEPIAARLGPLPALAMFGLRAARSTWAALRHGPTLRGLALVASVTAIDTIGALAAPAVYRWLTGASTDGAVGEPAEPANERRAA
jgi:GT2 family glycosyltransferase